MESWLYKTATECQLNESSTYAVRDLAVSGMRRPWPHLIVKFCKQILKSLVSEFQTHEKVYLHAPRPSSDIITLVHGIMIESRELTLFIGT